MKAVTRALLVGYLVLLHGVLVYLLFEKYRLIVPADISVPSAATDNSKPGIPTSTAPTVTLTPCPTVSAADGPALAATPTPSGSSSLLVPVAGIGARQLTDTFDQARSGGRVHDAIDIPAAAGTAVVAAADGTIVKFHDSELGGITIYQLSEDKNFVLYYAHLQRRAETLQEGKVVRRGETIAYVGDTGNAGAGNFHLHFAIWRVTDPKRFWNGENLNPYPLLRNNLPLPDR